MRNRKEIPGWWSSQMIGHRDPYVAWMPNLMVVVHCVPRAREVKQRFRTMCRTVPDRYGVYYDALSDDDRGQVKNWNTYFKLYAPITRFSSQDALMHDLLTVLETKTTRGSPRWVARWKKKYGRWKKALHRRRL